MWSLKNWTFLFYLNIKLIFYLCIFFILFYFCAFRYVQYLVHFLQFYNIIAKQALRMKAIIELQFQVNLKNWKQNLGELS